MIAFRLGAQDMPELLVGGEPWLHRLGIAVSVGGRPVPEGEGPLSRGRWEEMRGRDRWGEFSGFVGVYELLGEPFGELRLKGYQGKMALAEFVLLRDVDFLGQEDSFDTPSLLAPTFIPREDLHWGVFTFGLGGREEEYPGGYWPEFLAGVGPEALPGRAFAPMVLWDSGGALAISPGNWFLTSPMARFPRGVGRGLHGAVRELRRGFSLVTWFVAAPEPGRALKALGNLLLSLGGKKRPRPEGFVFLERPGWWNAYGGYYTELINPLREENLRALGERIRAERLPLGYVGLDLWYRFRRIGEALRYQPDPGKYPSGLAGLRAEIGLPYVLHLSSLAEENEYGAKPGDPGVYPEIARELRYHGAVAAWHDWLRTQQFSAARLRSDPKGAEAWFAGMAQAFRDKELPVILCMQTMGMVLSSTQHDNIISARSYTDFLFVLPAALEEAARRGHPELLEAAIPLERYRIQNLLVGSALYALGLLPFQDLFLTRENPGIGGQDPQGEALLRALSLGPVGVGDREDLIDAGLLARLVDGKGRLVRPDSPPEPIWRSLSSQVKLFWSRVEFDGIPWIYLLGINGGGEEARLRLEPPVDREFLLWDLREGALAPWRQTFAPGEMKAFLLSPLIKGVAFLGDPERILPVHRGMGLHPEEKIRFRVEGLGRLLVWSRGPVRVESKDGALAGLSREGELTVVHLSRPGTLRIGGR